MSRPVNLESFGARAFEPPPERPPEPAPPVEEHPLFQQGFAAGAAAARAEAQAGLERAATEALAAVGQHRIEREAAAAEARRIALGALAGVVQRLRPALAAQGAAEEVLAAIEPLLSRPPADRLSLRAPAPIAPLIERALAERGGSQPEVISDPRLSGAQAVIDWGDGLARIDLESVGSAVEAALAQACAEMGAETPQPEPEPEPEPAASAADACASGDVPDDPSTPDAEDAISATEQKEAQNER